MSRVSVLLTCYNHMPLLIACLEGVRAQTFTDFELIAIDDGSTDGTREWLTANLSNEPNCKVIFNEKNLGTYATLNVGLQQASGEFIAILNDDDLWAPSKLQQQIELMESFPKVGLVHTGGRFIDQHGATMEGSPLGFEFPKTETGDALLSLMYANKIIASAALVRAECFKQLGGFNESYFGSGDWEMWIRIAEQWEIGFVNDDLTFYRVHGANASHKHERIWKDDQKLREWLDGRSREYGHLNGELLRKACAHNLACLGTVLTLSGNRRAGRAAFSRSLTLDPARWKSRLRWLATFLPRKVFARLN